MRKNFTWKVTRNKSAALPLEVVVEISSLFNTNIEQNYSISRIPVAWNATTNRKTAKSRTSNFVVMDTITTVADFGRFVNFCDIVNGLKMYGKK